VKRRGLNLVLVAGLLLLTAFLPATVRAQQAQYICNRVLYTVYPDGSVNVTYVLTPTAAPEDIVVPTEAQPVLVIAVDISGEYLPVSFNESAITVTVYTTDQVTVSYLTLGMTAKEGEYWFISVNPVCEAGIVLPDNALPVTFSPEPVGMVLADSKLVFVFHPGNVTIKYLLLPEVANATSGQATTTTTATTTSTTSTPISQKPTQTKETWTPITPPSSPVIPNQRSPTAQSALPIVMGAVVAAAAALYFLRSGKNPDNPDAGNLDERDREILESLKQGPKTASELMRETGMPKTPLYRRLKKLEEMGLIEHFKENGVKKFRLKKS
jgi:uncharacterized membrane protein